MLWSEVSVLLSRHRVCNVQTPPHFLSLSSVQSLFQKTLFGFLGETLNSVFFVLAVEQWTSSTPSVGSWRVHGSSLNHSTCFLWTWRRRSPVSLGESCGWCSGVWGKLDVFPVRVGLCQGCPLSPILFIISMDRISRCS